jgi:hypothetical protein
MKDYKSGKIKETPNIGQCKCLKELHGVNIHYANCPISSPPLKEDKCYMCSKKKSDLPYLCEAHKEKVINNCVENSMFLEGAGGEEDKQRCEMCRYEFNNDVMLSHMASCYFGNLKDVAFVDRLLSKARTEGYKEGSAYVGRLKREAYQRGYEQARFAKFLSQKDSLKIIEKAKKQAQKVILKEIEEILPYGAGFTGRFYTLKEKYL